MAQIQSLVLLVNSMTIAEKRTFRVQSCQTKSKPNYIVLYEIIEKNGSLSAGELRNHFLAELPGASFETAVKYLFELILHTMLDLRQEQDSFYELFNKILKARILYEKSLFDECFELLNEVMGQAEKYENYYAMLLATRLELEYLLALGFPNLTEKELLQKQFRLNEALKYTRKIDEQSSLYEILKHRILYKGYPRTQQQKNELNDLVFSELSMMASQNIENLEIRKLHQLFQSNYLISVGDYNSALNSYYELNSLFEANRHMWSNPPVFYLDVLEGVLESLRSIRNYDEMAYFINQLKKIESTSMDFRMNLICLSFQYELFPFLDRGDFQSCLDIMNQYKNSLYDKISTLDRVRQTELCLYSALVYLGVSDFHKARKFLNQIFLGVKNFSFLPLYRTVRLVNLIILNKLGDFDVITYQIRSMKRDLSGAIKGYKIERFLFRFLSKTPTDEQGKTNRQWEKVKPVFEEIQHDVFEQQILRIFDFTAWIESEIRKVPLAEVLYGRVNH